MAKSRGRLPADWLLAALGDEPLNAALEINGVVVGRVQFNPVLFSAAVRGRLRQVLHQLAIEHAPTPATIVRTIEPAVEDATAMSRWAAYVGVRALAEFVQAVLANTAGTALDSIQSCSRCEALYVPHVERMEHGRKRTRPRKYCGECTAPTREKHRTRPSRASEQRTRRRRQALNELRRAGLSGAIPFARITQATIDQAADELRRLKRDDTRLREIADRHRRLFDL